MTDMTVAGGGRFQQERQEVEIGEAKAEVAFALGGGGSKLNEFAEKGGVTLLGGQVVKFESNKEFYVASLTMCLSAFQQCQRKKDDAGKESYKALILHLISGTYSKWANDPKVQTLRQLALKVTEAETAPASPVTVGPHEGASRLSRAVSSVASSQLGSGAVEASSTTPKPVPRAAVPPSTTKKPGLFGRVSIRLVDVAAASRSIVGYLARRLGFGSPLPTELKSDTAMPTPASSESLSGTLQKPVTLGPASDPLRRLNIPQEKFGITGDPLDPQNVPHDFKQIVERMRLWGRRREKEPDSKKQLQHEAKFLGITEIEYKAILLASGMDDPGTWKQEIENEKKIQEMLRQLETSFDPSKVPDLLKLLENHPALGKPEYYAKLYTLFQNVQDEGQKKQIQAALQKTITGVSSRKLVQHPLNPLNRWHVFFRILNFAYHAYIPM